MGGGALGMVFGLAEALNIFPFQRSAACVAHQTNQFILYIHPTISSHQLLPLCSALSLSLSLCCAHLTNKSIQKNYSFISFTSHHLIYNLSTATQTQKKRIQYNNKQLRNKRTRSEGERRMERG